MTKSHFPRVCAKYIGGKEPSDCVTKEVDQLVKSVLEILEGSVFANTPVQLFILYGIQDSLIYVTTFSYENRHRCINRVKTFRPSYNLMNKKISKMVNECVDRCLRTESGKDTGVFQLEDRHLRD